ncbi:MAG TPA: hypothetical protein PKC39_09840 [Ferruginibacter sp.]|nr:hypothetical protein [Ferruginibacter sp.]HMP21249.1 hypothetical protein [Ferruginibacter sp.]
MRFLKFSPVFHVLLPIASGIFLLYAFRNKVGTAEDIGLGKDTYRYYPYAGKYPIHLKSPRQLSQFTIGWKQRGEDSVYLWLGNSQLHGINQYSPGQVNAVEALQQQLQPYNTEVMGASYPNANMQELLVSALYFVPLLKVKALIVPVFFDDMREDNIRQALQLPGVAAAVKERRIYVDSIQNIAAKFLQETGEKDDAVAAYTTGSSPQAVTERWLNRTLRDNWQIWKKRPDYRGAAFNFLYLCRNQLLGIHAGTVRHVIPGVYRQNYMAISALLQFCRDQNIPLVIYIPPIRNDIPLPYNSNDYSKFKNDIERDCRAEGARFINLENLLPPGVWGSKSATRLNGKDMEEIDFMHFRAQGHQLLADTMFKILQAVR